ncbi:hypothetical protein [Streptomyces sp. NPDC005953]|uniref:hypothetical protein n=1 Tax=Streptomyces sp. NPDC005953 TaxID=3156719 RepID=UPI0033E88EE4
MKREELLSAARRVLWSGLLNSGDDVVSAAPQIFIDADMLVPPGGASKLAQLGALLNAQPAELTDVQAEALIDAGNGALSDYYHERACACSEYPSSCVTDRSYRREAGHWDTDAFAIGLPAVVALWEVMRAGAGNELARLRARLVALENDAQAIRGVLSPNGEDRKVPEPLGESLVPAVEWLVARVAELEADLARYVGHEPTVAEEVAYLRRCVTAVHDVCDGAEQQATRWEVPLPVPEWVETVRTAADGGAEPAESGTCRTCGAVPADWCSGCGACPDGCHGGHRRTEPCPAGGESS